MGSPGSHRDHHGNVRGNPAVPKGGRDEAGPPPG